MSTRPAPRTVRIDGIEYLVTASRLIGSDGPFTLSAWRQTDPFGGRDGFSTIASHGTPVLWGQLGTETNGPYRSLPAMSDLRIQAVMQFQCLTALGARAVIAAAFPEAGVVVDRPYGEMAYTVEWAG